MKTVDPIKPMLPAQTLTGTENMLSPDQRKLKDACQGFEAIFIRQILQKMRDSLPKDGLFGQSQATQTYQSMMDDALAESISKGGQVGLAEVLYQQLVNKVSLPESASEETDAAAVEGKAIK